MRIVTFADGSTARLSEKAYWDRRGAFQARLGTGLHFMRIGAYAVITASDDFASGPEYDGDGSAPAWEEVWSNPDHLRSFGRDRLSQCARIEAALDRFPQHPHASAIRDIIAFERAGWRGIGC